MKFTVEITKVEVKKTVSQDKEYTVVMKTDDPHVIQLAQYINETTVEIEIKE